MDTKSKAEKILSEIAQSDNSDPLDVAGVCQAYITQCQEVERLESLVEFAYKSGYNDKAESRIMKAESFVRRFITDQKQ